MNYLWTNLIYIYIYLNESKQMTDVELLLLYSDTWNRLSLCKNRIIRVR